MSNKKVYECLLRDVSANEVSIDEETGNLKFSGMAFTGGAVDRWFGILGIDLSNVSAYNKTTSEIPLLWGHNEYSAAIGRAKVSFNSNVKVEEGIVYNSDNIPYAKATIDLINQGHPIQLSIGVSGNLLQLEKTEERFINGKTQLVDAILVDVVLQEISFVNFGADNNTFVTKMNKEILSDVKEISKMTITQEQLNALTDTNTTLSAKLSVAEAKNIQLAADNQVLADKVALLEQEQKYSKTKEKFASLKLSDEVLKTLASLGDEQQEQMAKEFTSKIPKIDLSKDEGLKGDEKDAKILNYGGLKVDLSSKTVSI
ncbi:MAG TPA: hypothetical protein VN698_14195 [Bacteroidia bacterium]|nr:hypothetical protein [Bacteroidia bacterium]